MSARTIVRLGHPALRIPAHPVAPGELALPATQELIDDMIATMRAASGVGLAAPQVGVSLQIFVYEAAHAEGRDAGIPLHVLVNPMLTPQAGELVYDWEGCLSIPDLRGLVPRHPAVRVRSLDRDGRPLDYAVSGFEARIVQHEFDHLNAIVFLDRMRDFKTLAFYEEWERYMLDHGEAELAEDAEDEGEDELYEDEDEGEDAGAEGDSNDAEVL
jgi:peptide deformylase